jgi:hypothetical protein
MSQMTLGIIDEVEQDLIDSTYTKKVSIPLYVPQYRKPYVHEMYNFTKTKKLIDEINKSSVDDEIKQFLIMAAHRHTVIDFSKVADYYAHSSKEVQELIEKQALVIVDFNKAIEYGYVRLNDDIANQYIKDNGNG